VIAILIGVVLKASTMVWIVLVIAALVWIAASERISRWLPMPSFEREAKDGSLLTMRVRRPEIWGRRRLRRATEAIINDWHRYTAESFRAHPDDMAEANVAMKAADDRDVAWPAVAELLNRRGTERRDRWEASLRKRVGEMEIAYLRRGLLAEGELTRFPDDEMPSDSIIRTDHLGMAMRRLEALQTRL
jgi:hypothetical protein